MVAINLKVYQNDLDNVKPRQPINNYITISYKIYKKAFQ